MIPAPRRLGVFGGTFDPVHRAHVALVQLFFERLALDELRVMPAGAPWQKDGVVASPRARLHMLELALRGAPEAIRIDARELHRTGPTYTVDTLREIRAEVGPQALVVLLMGNDQLAHLHTWHDWGELVGLANLAIAGRPGFTLDTAGMDGAVQTALAPRCVDVSALPGTLDQPNGQVALIPADLGNISSTELRRHLRAADYGPISDLVPSEVLEFIQLQRIYTA